METIVKPKTVRLSLSDGQYIYVKRRLNTGEHFDLYHAAMSSPYQVKGAAPYTSGSFLITKVLAYLVSWSLTDQETGLPLPMSHQPPIGDLDDERMSTVRSIGLDVFNEIREAIDAHEIAVQKEIDARKNGQAGDSKPISSLPSPDGAISPSPTSVN